MLAQTGARTVLLVTVIGVAAVLVLAMTGAPEVQAVTRPEALRTLALALPAALGAVSLVAGVGAGVHGARHVGGVPAPTSAEIRTFAGPAAVGPVAGPAVPGEV
jgi:hypothetical protein